VRGLCLSASANTGADEGPGKKSSVSVTFRSKGCRGTISDPNRFTSTCAGGSALGQCAHCRSTYLDPRIELGSTVDSAHLKLDQLCAVPAKEESEEAGKEAGDGERRVLWQFAETDYKALFIKADSEERITSITALLRPGREQPFDKIGDLNKAPIISESEVAWDVIRPDHPLFRVVGRGYQKEGRYHLNFCG